jgi:hypothetical protein
VSLPLNDLDDRGKPPKGPRTDAPEGVDGGPTQQGLKAAAANTIGQSHPRWPNHYVEAATANS